MAIPPILRDQILFGQVPPPAPKKTSGEFKLNDAKPVDTRANFDAATKEFGLALSKLPPEHKARIRAIHKAVESFVADEQKAGRKADRLATFVGRVMEYTNEELEKIEKKDPDLKTMKRQHQELDKAFKEGAELIDAYHAWVKDKKAK
ncbi:MAG: hypothetical protein AB7S38_02475 [Vulcanimicrobiota bacterium]